MGNDQSQEETPTEFDPELTQILEQNTYHPSSSSPYPYFLVQLSEYEELEYNGRFVSDAICQYIAQNPVTHILAQTHGWNTPPDKAVAVPFTEFIGGMQNDHAMPRENFFPLFVAFIWPAVPIQLGREQNALTRLDLLAASERDNVGPHSDIVQAAVAAKQAVEHHNDEAQALIQGFHMLARNATGDTDSDTDDDEDVDVKVERVRQEARNAGVFGGIGDAVGNVVADVTTRVLTPFENLVFGRLMKRGNRTGKVMERVLASFMSVKSDAQKIKVCLMANSLGAHVLAGILNKPRNLPYKVHTVFFVQGAITRDLFEEGGKFERCKENVAGPIVCTHSEKDLMLKNIYAFFHGEAIGIDGVERGEKIEMKSLEEAEEEPYEFKFGEWNSVNGTRYIDEGNAVAGGHGDFKEDETTSLYWAAIKAVVDDSSYER